MMQVKCEGEHCVSGIASIFCHSDGCFLCSSCDTEVHSNKITQRHVRVPISSAPAWALGEARSKGIVFQGSNQEAWGDSGPIHDPFPACPPLRAGDFGSAPNCGLILTASVASGDDPSNGNSAGSGSCHPDVRIGSSSQLEPSAPDFSGTIKNRLLNTTSSRLSSPGQGSKGQVNNLANAVAHAHAPYLDPMDVSDLIPPGALDLAQHMDNSLHGNRSEGSQLANLFELFGIPNPSDGSQHGSVHQGANWLQQQQREQQEKDERIMLDVLLSGSNVGQGQGGVPQPKTRPHQHSPGGLLSAAFNPLNPSRPNGNMSNGFPAPYQTNSLAPAPFFSNLNPKVSSVPIGPFGQQQPFRPNPLATCQSVHEGGLFAAAAACHDGAAYAAIMNGGLSRGPSMTNPTASASYSLGKQPSYSSLAAAAAAAEAGGSGSFKQVTFGSLKRDSATNLGSETHSDTAVRGGSLYLSTVASGSGQKRVLDLNSVPPPPIGSLPRNPGSFRRSLNGNALGVDVPLSWSLQDPPTLSPSFENTPRSKALHSTLHTSPSMHHSSGGPQMNGPQMMPSGHQLQLRGGHLHRGLSMDGKFGSMEQTFLGQSFQAPGPSYGSLDHPDVSLPHAWTRQPILTRASSMLPLQEHPSELSQLQPISAKGEDPDRAAMLNRYRLKKMNRLKAYAQDSLQEKKGRQSSRQGRARANGRIGSRDDESVLTNCTSPDGSSEHQREREAGEEDTSRIRLEMNLIHLGYNPVGSHLPYPDH